VKKILYSLLVFISAFIFIDSVNATTFTSTFSSSSVNGLLIDIFDREFPTVQTANIEAIENGILSDYGEHYICNAYTSWSSLYCYVSNSLDDFGAYFDNSAFRFVYTYTGNSVIYELNLKNGSISSTKTPTTVQNHTSIGGSSSNYVQITNIPYFKMLRPDDIYDSVSVLETSNGYVFNRGDILIYNDNGTFILNTEYKTEEDLTDNPNIYNEEIDDINYSKMIFHFDVDVFKERNNIFDYLIDFESIGTIQDDMSLNESHIQKFSSPYIEYVNKNGITKRLEIDFGYDDQVEIRGAWYVAQKQEISSDIKSLKLVIPMDKTAYSRYKINFVSYIPFTVSYETNEEALLYYANVDLTNKYGVMFMPKLIENNSDISSIFYTTGIESVLVYSSYNLKEEPIEIYNTNLSEFNYTISYENTNYNLFFKVSTLTPELGIVTYDTRYYTYKIITSEYEINTIINPNTNQEFTIDFSNTVGNKLNYNNINDLFDNIKKFNSDIGPVTAEILGVFQYGFDSMNNYIKTFLIVIFIIILVAATIKIIRK